MKIMLAVILLFTTQSLNARVVERRINPSVTDKRIDDSHGKHFVMMDPSKKNSQILLFLPGTKGRPLNGPKEFYQQATEQHYRVISLAYPNELAVSQICTILRHDEYCADRVRKKRIYGTDETSLISDKPVDAIIPRLSQLLIYLAKTFPQESWDQFLLGDQPNWKRFALSGQSQGGGMAAFLAKDFVVARVLIFSGGWDHRGRKNTFAHWYEKESLTPHSQWYGFYHRKESRSASIQKTYELMKIPSDQIFALTNPRPQDGNPHNDGIRNPKHKSLWIRALE